MTSKQAYRIAVSWGSYINTGDPGRCMYGFHFDDGRPVSEVHRAQCMAYVDGILNPGAAKGSDSDDLHDFNDWLASAPLYGEVTA
jgi:hypothetical protein